MASRRSTPKVRRSPSPSLPSSTFVSTSDGADPRHRCVRANLKPVPRCAAQAPRAGSIGMPVVTTFGEVMLRLKTPGYQRFVQSQELEATFGGGEANVAVSLARLGHTSRWVSVVPKNPIGEWALGELRKLGVDVSHVLRRGERLGIYFLEAGASQRQSQIVYDRGRSSVSALATGELE